LKNHADTANMGRVKIIKGLSFFSFLFFLILSGTSLLYSLIAKNPPKDTLISPLVQTVRDSKEQLFSLFASDLDSKVQGVLGENIGTYSIIVTNLKTGESYRQNPERQYYSASLYKLWLMATVYQEMKNGTIKEDDVLEASIPSLNATFKIASEEAELTEGSIKRTVKEALEQSIIISHNYSALLLSKKVGVSKMAAFLKQEGLNNSKVGSPPLTSASDIATFYLKLYRKELVDEKSSEEMLALLKRQALNDRIPKYLPNTTPVAHKTGELYGYKHDAGIVFSTSGDYIIVELSETKNPATAAERMAQISKIVYEYFENKKN